MIAFARGTSLENSFVSVSDALGNAVDGVSANIVASGVYDLSGRKAVAPSKGILIVDGAKKVLK